MKTVLLLLSKSILCVLVATTAFARGGRDGGGGNVCFPDGQGPILFSLLSDGAKSMAYYQNRPGYRLPETNRLLEVDFKQGSFAELREEAIRRISFYKNVAQQETALLLESLNGLYFYQVPGRANRPSEVAWKEQTLCHRGNTRAAVFFTGKQVVIFWEDWNQLSFESQVGVLITEAARVLQTAIPNAAIDNGELQTIVAGILDQDPSLHLPSKKLFTAATHGICQRQGAGFQRMCFGNDFPELRKKLPEDMKRTIGGYCENPASFPGTGDGSYTEKVLVTLVLSSHIYPQAFTQIFKDVNDEDLQCRLRGNTAKISMAVDAVELSVVLARLRVYFEQEK